MKRAFILFFFLSAIRMHAGHYFGADVSYKHLKGQEYEVNVVFYRDCSGIALPDLDLQIQNDSFYLFTKLTRIKIEDILYNCGTKMCNPSNTTISGFGFEAHYFRDTIDFNSGIFKKFLSGNYCRVSLGVGTCCRPSLQTSDNIYVEAMLDLCYAKNNQVSTSSFFNTIKPHTSINQPVYYSFRTTDAFAGDSISYDLVKGKESYNQESNFYGGTLPLRPYCVPQGNGTCTPIPGATPPRGFYFNEHSGNMVYTPVVSALDVIVCRIKTFRKDSGKYKLVGYSKRDMQVAVMNNPGNNVPVLNNFKDNFVIKAREKFCTDIVLKDDTVKNQVKDTIKLKTIIPPKYGQLSLPDSNAREKTLRFCWNPSDSDYLKKKEDNVFIYAYDKGCVYGSDLSASFHFKVIAPDSLTNITIKTYYDKNKNGRKDAGEPYRSAPVIALFKTGLSHLQTDTNGILSIKPFYNKFTIGLNRGQFLYATSGDTLLFSRFDSTHLVEIGFNYIQGIKGKAFEDLNNNCVFDANDIPLKGLKITAKNTNAAAFTDTNGDYLFNNATGSYVLGIDGSSLYKSTCNNTLNVSIVKDSQFTEFNFPLKKKTGFTDISISLNPQTHNRNNAKMTQLIVLENKGQLKAGKMTVKLLPSRKLFQFSSTFTSSFNKDTIFLAVDSVSKGAVKTIDFSHFLMADSFSNGDRITYQVWASFSDSVPSNNYYELTETIGNQACCKTEKVAYSPDLYYPIYKGITYRLNFIPVEGTYRALITDTIDDTRFDLGSLRLLSKSVNITAWLNGNILSVNFVQSSFLNNAEFIYTIDLKNPLTDSFTVYNKATCNFDNQVPVHTNKVATRIISPFAYDTLSKNAFCSNETMRLGFMTSYKPLPGNRFRVYLSDSLGNFSQQSLLLDTAAYSLNNRLNVKLPRTYRTNTYKIKVVGTQPPLEAFAGTALPVIQVQPLPLISFKTNLINGGICRDDTFKLNASGVYDYQFLKNGNPSGSFTSDSVYSETMQTGANYQIRVRSQAGCINTSPVLNAAMHNLPNVILNAGDLKLCDGEMLALQFTGAKTYTLFRDTSMLIASGITTSPYQFIPPLNKSRYTMAGTDVNGCRDTSNGIDVEVMLLPAKPVITQNGQSLRSGYSFNNQWHNLNGKIDSAAGQYFYPPKSGKYFVRHTDINGCESTSDIFDFIASATKVVTNLASFNIYPNPANDILTIANTDGVIYSFKLYDAFGRVILSDTSENKLNTIAVANLSAGNYYLCISTSGGVMNFPLVVMH